MPTRLMPTHDRLMSDPVKASGPTGLQEKPFGAWHQIRALGSRVFWDRLPSFSRRSASANWRVHTPRTVPVLMYAVNSMPQCGSGRDGLPAQRRPAPPAPAKQSMQVLTRFGGVCTAEGTSIAACAANSQKKTHWDAGAARSAPPALAKQSMQVMTGFGGGCTAEGTSIAACGANKPPKSVMSGPCGGAPPPPPQQGSLGT